MNQTSHHEATKTHEDTRRRFLTVNDEQADSQPTPDYRNAPDIRACRRHTQKHQMVDQGEFDESFTFGTSSCFFVFLRVLRAFVVRFSLFFATLKGVLN